MQKEDKITPNFMIIINDNILGIVFYKLLNAKMTF